MICTEMNNECDFAHQQSNEIDLTHILQLFEETKENQLVMAAEIGHSLLRKNQMLTSEATRFPKKIQN